MAMNDELFTLPFGDEELITPEEGRFPQPTWFNYKNPIVDLRGRVIRDAAGYHYEAAKCTPDLANAFEILVADGKAEFVLVRHPDAVKEYYSIKNAVYVPLATGLPSSFAIPKEVRNQLGVAAGTYIQYYRDSQTTEKLGFVGVLAVVQQLWEAGYSDGDTAKPVLLRGKSYAGNELHDVLKAHIGLVTFARQHVPDPRPKYWGQMWTHSFTLKSDRKIEHGKKGTGGQVSDARLIESGHPDKDTLTPEYAASTYVGDDLARALLPWVYTAVNGQREVGGPAIDWCRAEVERANKSQKDLDPQGTLPWGRKPAPLWIIEKFTGAGANQSATPTPPAESSGTSPERDTLIAGLSKQLAYFNTAGREAGRSVEDRRLADEWVANLNDLFTRLQGDGASAITVDTLKAQLARSGSVRAKLMADSPNPVF